MTIREIAEKAGVSIATVSRVINNVPNVSPKTRKKVLAILNKYGFQTDPWARRLANKKRTTTILILLSSRLQKGFNPEKNGFYENVVKGINSASRWGNIVTTLKNLEETIKKRDFKGIDGIIFVGGDTTEQHVKVVQKRGLPMVLIDQYIPTLKVDCVVSNGFDGASYAISYLISKGLKKIIHIHGFLDHFGFKDRFEGYVSTMESYGLLPTTYEYDDECMEDMKPIIRRILNTKGVPDAIFASNDAIALRTIQTLKEFDLKVPDDVSVVGFDGSEEGRRHKPSLSSLKIPMEEMGSLAMKRLLDIIYGEDIYPVRISLFTEFIKGESSL